MSAPLFYADSADIGEGIGGVRLHGQDARHLSRSLRAREGDEVKVADGRGGIYTVTLVEVGRDEVRGTAHARSEVAPEMPGITVFQSLSRPQHMDMAVSRAAEAGVSSLVPLESARSAPGLRDLSDERLRRWRRIALEASKVARRPVPLEVREASAWPPSSTLISVGEVNLVLWEEETVRYLGDALTAQAPGSIGVFVGCEGGFEGDEVSVLEELGAVPVTLGDNIFRTESAGAACALIIRHHYGLLRGGGTR